ncbi:MAG TPA: wax ester/triacylglycerol synthase family O-acyltransferase [Verrucomicrobiae bacterium]|nr:wax ester/triacylglycerol synthase family O-acyltransferase [Verrucomicrobiae bacterium]
MKPVGLVDQGFLWLERRNQPMHVGGLQLLRPPPDEPGWMERMDELARSATTAQPPFNQRLVRKGGMWFWDVDREFDVESHVHHLALPAPGRIRELLALVSKLHGNLMDRTKPLWEIYLISGLEDGRVAMYSKLHHALVDGVAATRMLLRQMSEDPGVREITPLWAIERPKRERVEGEGHSGPFAALAQAASLAREQVGTLPGVARELVRTVRARKDPDQITTFEAPRSILNQRISGARRFAAQSYSFKRIRAAGKKLDATVNDVALAMCAAALRRYLLDLEALPEKPLIAMVPVSTRKDDSDSGNQVAMVLASLATNIADPKLRLDAILRSMKASKERFQRMSPAEVMNYLGVVMGVGGLNMATGLLPTWQPFNVVISNVPGPRKTLYFNGAQMEGTYPVSIVLDGQALNITLTSYVDSIAVGLIACRRTLPHMQKLLGYLEDALVELESL